jgi:hypothetical protein
MNTSGQRLEGMTGVACILRFALPELDEMDDDDQDDLESQEGGEEDDDNKSEESKISFDE